MDKWLVFLALVGGAFALPTFGNFFNPPPPPPPKFQAPPTQDCVYGSWTAWSSCSAACDATAFISRTRIIIKEASGYGQKCEPSKLEEWQECRGEPCARDCVMEEWTSWSQCSAQCGQGQRSKWRRVASEAVNGGAPCGPTEETEPCFLRSCAVDCVMSQWSQWSDCSAQCEEGRRQRLRSTITPAANGGRACGPAEEWETCNNGPCPRDCVMGDWAPWSQCPACGQASRNRRRSIIEQGAFGGQVCDFNGLTETESCNNRPCAVDCVMEEWSAWSRCSADCGSGRRARTRSVRIPAAFGGQACGPAEEWEACQERPCAQDCEMTQWQQWSQCSSDCDGGRRARYRSVSKPARFGGIACGPAEEWETCNAQPCPRDCVLAEWAPWTPCPACGQASRSRRRSIATQGAFGGQQCDFTDLSETESCNNRPCAVDCVMEQWSAWSQCSSDCGEGRRQRLRSVRTPAAFGGRACGPAEEWEACNNGPCPRDCVMGDWAPWSQCPTCGQASRNRRRSIIEQGAFGGQVCDFNGLTETESCNLPSCAVDCVVSEWSAWSACNAECGSGSQQRLRSVRTQAANGGRRCPKLEDWRQCDNGPCRQPSICDGVRGTRFFAEGCTAEFILCSEGTEHPKICPEPSRFDVASSTCRLPQDVAACAPPPASPPVPAPKPTFFSRIRSAFSYDQVESTPTPTTETN